MKLDGLDGVAFEGSYLLGWSYDATSVSFDLELLILHGHPLFRPYNEDEEVGCFALATLVFPKAEKVSGIEGVKRPEYDEVLGEWRDCREIYGMTNDGDSVTIETDEDDIVVFAEAGELKYDVVQG